MVATYPLLCRDWQSLLRSSPLPLSVVHRMLLPGFVSIRQQVMPAVSPIRNVSVAGCTRNQPRFFVTDPEENLLLITHRGFVYFRWCSTLVISPRRQNCVVFELSSATALPAPAAAIDV